MLSLSVVERLFYAALFTNCQKLCGMAVINIVACVHTTKATVACSNYEGQSRQRVEQFFLQTIVTKD